MSDQEQQETGTSRDDIDLSGYLRGKAPAAPEPHGWGAVKYYHETSAPKMVRWVIQHSGGIVHTATQATYVLLIFTALAIAGSVLLVAYSLRDRRPNISLPPDAKIILPPGEPPRLEKPLRPR
ncbi:hypothetical protein HYZ80_03285 [Candidatus Parcubacteria bacterium]|nr:hypothetical protein [Candidatus Parcubacteria bacterium]